MRLIEQIINRETSDQGFSIRHLTDIHGGSRFCDEEAFRRDVAAIQADPTAYWIGGGDFAEFINRSDKRADEAARAPWLWGKVDLVKTQVEWLGDHLSPIADRCLGLVYGNHEHAILKHYERDVYGEIVGKLKRDHLIRLGASGFVVVRWRYGTQGRRAPQDVWSTTIYVEHGAGGGKVGAAATYLDQLAGSYDFDIALVGHRHLRLAFPRVHKVPSARARRVEERDQFVIMGGSYMQRDIEQENEDEDVESYAERNGYPARARGAVEVLVNPGQRRLRALM